MCNHKPITIYQDGGTSEVCSQCGRVLKPWRMRSESGQCLAICLLTLGGALLAFFVWYCLFVWTESRVLADIAATIVFLGCFFFAMKLCEGGGK